MTIPTNRKAKPRTRRVRGALLRVRSAGRPPPSSEQATPSAVCVPGDHVQLKANSCHHSLYPSLNLRVFPRVSRVGTGVPDTDKPPHREDVYECVPWDELDQREQEYRRGFSTFIDISMQEAVKAYLYKHSGLENSITLLLGSPLQAIGCPKEIADKIVPIAYVINNDEDEDILTARFMQAWQHAHQGTLATHPFPEQAFAWRAFMQFMWSSPTIVGCELRRSARLVFSNLSSYVTVHVAGPACVCYDNVHWRATYTANSTLACNLHSK